MLVLSFLKKTQPSTLLINYITYPHPRRHFWVHDYSDFPFFTDISGICGFSRSKTVTGILRKHLNISTLNLHGFLTSSSLAPRGRLSSNRVFLLPTPTQRLSIPTLWRKNHLQITGTSSLMIYFSSLRGKPEYLLSKAEKRVLSFLQSAFGKFDHVEHGKAKTFFWEKSKNTFNKQDTQHVLFSSQAYWFYALLRHACQARNGPNSVGNNHLFTLPKRKHWW